MVVPTTSDEVERTYTVPEGAALPPFHGVKPVAEVLPERVFDLDATYWDTRDLGLAAHGIRLRRRAGGHDSGWHVKLPAPGLGVVTEFQLPLGRGSRVPRALQTLVTAFSLGAELVPVARIRTRRAEHHLLDANGLLLASVADDDVQATGMQDGATPEQRWREIEVELGPSGDHNLLEALEERLLAAGATPAVFPSKAGRVLGDAVPEPWPSRSGRIRRRSPAGTVLTAYLREQVDAMRAQDPRVRRDEPGAVHKMRVATRRLRSALKTFGPLLDGETTKPVAAELRELAAVLGGMRDQEVQRARIQADLAALPAEMVLGPVAARVESTLSADAAKARRRAVAFLEGARYRALLERVVAIAAEPPLTTAADAAADVALPPLVGRVHARLGTGLADAAAIDDPRRREEAFHETRKIAKQLRYAGESIGAAFGADAARLARRATELQELLGNHQDSVVARGVLRRMGVAAQAAAESAFTYGLLVGVEFERAAAAERAAPEAWNRLQTRKIRRLLG